MQATRTRRATSAPAPPLPAVVFHRHPSGLADGHDTLSKAQVAEWLASLMGCDYAGDFDPAAPPAGRLFFVPTETLTVTEARRLGIRGSGDLFGGVVPEPFVATKLIAHPLPDGARRAPAGWQPSFPAAVAGAVLPGYSAFSLDDAQRGGERLLAEGTVRIKDPTGVGGVGQWVVSSGSELQARLAEIGAARVQAHGIVLERNLSRVVTHSVGQVQVGPLMASYHGTQSLVHNNRGAEVYGGSALRLVRGGFDVLLRQPLADDVRTAVEKALVFHQAATASFAAYFASRCNYDVVQGLEDGGRHRSGVLEQSWRIGGASGAEVAALQALQQDDALQAVSASTHEAYGDAAGVPAGARTLYDGVDRRVGRISKYVQLVRDGDG